MSIVLSGLTKRFAGHIVVNHVSLEVNDGEFFVLLGGSGAGKSTVLRMIAGLSEPDAGRIELNGRDVTYLPPQERNTGFVFQNYSIFRHMTAAENIEFGLRIRRAPAADRRRRSDELLELVGLAGLGNRYPHQLSGGQQQRVAIARALAQDPAVFLLDEPFGALDVKIRAQLRQSLKEIQHRLGVTTIQVTHDQEEAFELADRIGIVERGTLIEVGTAEDLYHRPRSEFAATFIGGGNVLVGRAEAGHIRLGGATLPFRPDSPAHDEGAPVRVLFRPETVRLKRERFARGGPTHTLAQGLVRDRLFAGPVQRIRLDVDGLQGVRPITPPPAYGQRTTQIESIQPSDAPGELFAPGQALWIGVESYHILEPTGLKLLVCCDETPGGEAVSEFGGRLAQAAGGPATLLSVVGASEAVAQARDRLEEMRRRYSPQQPMVHTRVRQGQSSAEILIEAQEGSFEVAILGRRSGADEQALGATALRLLEQSEVPLLFVTTPRWPLQRMLICTAGGEPGKTSILMGGRLARRTQADVSVLHIYGSRATLGEIARATRHVQEAQATLEAQGVRCQSRVEGQDDVAASILAEAESGDYDLVVIGAPRPQERHRGRRGELVFRIVESTARPVLIVPVVS